MAEVRSCRRDERDAILAIVNAAAEAYRGVIPADRRLDPYMTAAELDRELAAGVVFTGCARAGALVGVMGLQPVGDVDLIRHAYVVPAAQGLGVGRRLLEHLVASTTRPLLVGTWASATWAIRFYKRKGFTRTTPVRRAELLRTSWDIPERQVEAFVVLERRGPRAS